MTDIPAHRVRRQGPQPADKRVLESGDAQPRPADQPAPQQASREPAASPAPAAAETAETETEAAAMSGSRRTRRSKE